MGRRKGREGGKEEEGEREGKGREGKEREGRRPGERENSHDSVKTP
jgi:hypothetical protein